MNSKHQWERGMSSGDDGVSFVVADAMSLPFETESVDAYTISFGLRNVTDIDAAIGEAYRVLKPGGRMLIMEFSHLPNPLLRVAYQQYSNFVSYLNCFLVGYDCILPMTKFPIIVS